MAETRRLPPVLTIWRCRKCNHRLADVYLGKDGIVEIKCPKCKAVNTKEAA